MASYGKVKAVMPYQLRPYQKEAILSVMHQWRDGNRKTLLVLPTGTGKTIAFAGVAKICVEHHQRVLILAHRWELLAQARDKIKAAADLDCAIEKAEMSAADSDAMVVIASMQTLAQKKRLEQYSPDSFQAIILDEAHHALSPSYQRIFSYFKDAFVLGVTATAERGDKKELGQFFDSIAYEYSLPQAVNDGYLVPMKAATIPLKLDISNVKVQNGDYQPGELGEALEPYLEEIAEEMKKACMHRKTIVFLPLIRISRNFRDILNQKGFHAVEINGQSKNREEILNDFAQGKYNVICNSMLLTEGFDCPSIDCVVVLRPTQVRGLYAQMIGRGTRLSPGKKDLLILDFLWMSAKHDLCHPAGLIARSPEIEQRMTKMLQQGKELDLEECEEGAERDIIAERKRALAIQLEAQRTKQRRVLNPLEVGIMLNDTDITEYEPVFQYEKDKPTEKQLAALAKFGMDTSEVTSKGQAAVLLDKLINRSKAGLATLKQIRFLDSRNFQNVSAWKFSEASAMMNRIAENGWNVPQDIHPEEYVPDSLKHKRRRRRR